jgi:hypothetical protein
MTMPTGVTYRNAIAQQFETLARSLIFYSGARPGVDAAATGTVLATIALPVDFMTAPSGGASTLAATVSDTSADANGTLGYYRFVDGSGNVIKDGDCVTSGSAADTIVFSSLALTAGQQLNVTAFNFTVPAA